jgi:hypothetical protein
MLRETSVADRLFEDLPDFVVAFSLAAAEPVVSLIVDRSFRY